LLFGRRIKSLIFGGFTKSAHLIYKFDSKTEKDFAILLEKEAAILRWLRPAPNQFHIYYQHNSRQYRPDFIVETADCIYMVETKRADEVADPNVVAKAKAAKQYCENATNYNQMHGGKPWKYVIIPHHEVQFSATVTHLFQKNL
jgi:type III restriction enzyme